MFWFSFWPTTTNEIRSRVCRGSPRRCRPRAQTDRRDTDGSCAKRNHRLERCSEYGWRSQHPLEAIAGEEDGPERPAASLRSILEGCCAAKCRPWSASTIPWEKDRWHGSQTSAACLPEVARFPPAPLPADRNETNLQPEGRTLIPVASVPHHAIQSTDSRIPCHARSDEGTMPIRTLVTSQFRDRVKDHEED